MESNIFSVTVDELGRIIVPKVIRQTLDIKERDILDVCIKDNEIILKKHNIDK